MIDVDTILVIVEIVAFALLVGLVIYSIKDYYAERNSSVNTGYPALIDEDDAYSQRIFKQE